MNRITTIVLFAGIFAVTVGTLGIGGISATPLMVSAAPQSQEGMGMLGHVEYKVLDESGNVKAYMQNDNVVVEAGKDCAAKALFSSAASVGQCTAAVTDFRYIGIGNGTTGGVGVANQTLADTNVGNNVGECAATGAGNGGDMARRLVTPTFDVSGTTAIVTLDTSSAPFKFTASNATSVKDSGVFNGNYGTPGTGGICGGTNTAGTTWSMFSRQLLNGATGITVANGDSLSVKWTITVG